LNPLGLLPIAQRRVVNVKFFSRQADAPNFYILIRFASRLQPSDADRKPLQKRI
jgi:hypothetical protein